MNTLEVTRYNYPVVYSDKCIAYAVKIACVPLFFLFSFFRERERLDIKITLYVTW